jgi:hypothetical protein
LNREFVCVYYWDKFNKETNFYYRKTDKELFINTPPDLKDPEEFFLKSYDLETLLDALPEEREGFGGDAYFRMSKDGFWYEEWGVPQTKLLLC